MALAVIAGGSNLVTVNSLDTAGDPYVPDTLQITFNKTVSTEMTGILPDTPVVMDIENKGSNEDFDTFVQANFTKVNLTVIEQTYEDGSIDESTATPSNAIKNLYMHAKPLSNGKHRIRAFVGILSGDTGNESYANGSNIDVPVQVTAVPAAKDIVISANDIKTNFPTLFSATPSAGLTIETGKYGVDGWISV